MSLNTWLFSDLLLLCALVFIYLGAAGFLGNLVYQARKVGRLLQLILYILTFVTLSGISFLQPWNSNVLHFLLLLVYAFVLLFSLHPKLRFKWITNFSVSYRYISFTLILVVFWALSGEISPTKLLLIPWAGLAASLAWQRSQEDFTHSQFVGAVSPTQPSTTPDEVQGSRGAV
jgi:hypothetical protein